MHPLLVLFGMCWRNSFFHSSIVVHRSFCIIFISYSIFDCKGCCRFLFAFLCCNRTVFVIHRKPWPAFAQWIDVLCSFAHEGLYWTRPICQHIYLLIDFRHVFDWTASLCWFFSLVNVSNNRYHLWRKSHSLLTHRSEWNNTSGLRDFGLSMKIHADFNMNETHAREQIDF